MPACSSEGACLEGLWASSPSNSKSSSPAASAAVLPPTTGTTSASSPTSTTTTTTSISLLERRQSHINKAELSRLKVDSSPIGNGRHAPRSQLAAPQERSSAARRIFGYLLLWPALWVSFWLWVGWLCLQPGLACLRLLPWPGERYNARQQTAAGPRRGARPCVLLSGGSSVQTVRLARSLSEAGARVVVYELEGLFGLARFSRACTRYYSVPRPGPRSGAAAYVRALRDIVSRERVSAFVPVNTANPAYYDALARKHLESLGVDCWVPRAQECLRLDDPLELLSRARKAGLAVPTYRLLSGGLQEAQALSESGDLRGPYVAVPAGPVGMRERGPELRLPLSPAELQRYSELRSRWLVLLEPCGARFVTCTTLRDTRLLSNVTCRLEVARNGTTTLLPEPRADIDHWLERYFELGWADSAGCINGHLSFRFGLGPGNELLPLGCRVGLGPAYLSQEARHARLLLRPLIGVPRQTSLQQLHQQQQPSCGHGNHASDSSSRGLDKREALFIYWDPLPYCVYCWVQLPFRRLADALGAQRAQHQPPLAVVQ
ncbi:uncharacterized protein LOC106651906 [Trichogramma pretiosum]|uniref:uncharacterized protein LOC106651906 n=1 Tax=Trichogramma pretiosum TaxID=7493 RepID=UPI0006C95BD4|nr:uncharacterized protein LOC106651906 [Trichogramma pretiosum]